MALKESHPARVLAAKRQNEALELRQCGMTYIEIGERLGITAQAAGKCVRRALKILHDDTNDKTSRYVDLELSRLDKLYQIAYDQSVAGDLLAIDRCLKIADTRAKLLGLYAPTKTIIDVDVKTLTIEQLERVVSGKDINAPVS